MAAAVAALLTWRSAVIKEDKELLRESYLGSRQKRGWNVNFKDEPDWGPKTRGYFIEHMTFLSTPAWPEHPQEGCIHPVYMCYPGTLLRCDTEAVIFHDGKWRVVGNTGNWLGTDVSAFNKPE